MGIRDIGKSISKKFSKKEKDDESESGMDDFFEDQASTSQDSNEDTFFAEEYSPDSESTSVVADDTDSGELQDNVEELEELVEPLPEMPLLPGLESGTVLPIDAAESRAIRIIKITESRPGLNIYQAALIHLVIDPDTNTEENVSLEQTEFVDGECIVRVREAQELFAERLSREANARLTNASPMMPKVLGCFEYKNKTYLVDEEPPADITFEKLLQPGTELTEIIHVLAQVAAAVAQLHAAGWAYLGLQPSNIMLSKPLQVTDFTFVTPMGEPSPPLSFAGYSAPELAAGAVADARMDIYSIGALLYAGAGGEPIPETGVDLELWSPPVPLPGVPQILQKCLGDIDTRYNTVTELHRDLVRLKNRLKPIPHYEIAASSTIGLELGRNTNQDSYCHLSGTINTEEGAFPWAVLCVADGMGGMAAGEVASEIAVRSVAQEACSAFVGQAMFSLSEQIDITRQWAHSANKKVVEAMENRGVRGGCTFVCACVVNNILTIAHIGDSRIYLIRGEEVRQLTNDHSFVMALVQQGEIAKDDIRTHPDRNKVTRSMGDRHPMPDYFVDTLEVATGKSSMELQNGDIILLCSDGLWEPVLETEMQAAIANHPLDLPAAAQELLAITLKRGAPDNATVALLQISI